METITIGKPILNVLSKCEKAILLNPLVEVIISFYKNHKNRKVFEKWLAEGKPMTTKGRREVANNGSTS